MSTDQQQSTEAEEPDREMDEIEAEHRRTQESGEVFEGGPYSDR